MHKLGHLISFAAILAIGFILGVTTQNDTIRAFSPKTFEVGHLCTVEDSCTLDWTNGAWWIVPDNTDIPDCEDVVEQTPCYTYDEDEWRLITSYHPYEYELLIVR